VVKAVFFDWFNTLARYDPPREELEYQALQEFGITASPEEIKRGLLIADTDYYQENTVSPIRQRSPEEQAKVFVHYQKTVLGEAGISAREELLLRIMSRLRELYAETTFILFDDVIPTLKTLKKHKLILGLVTNLSKEIDSICQKLGIASYLNFIVSSEEAGADKPEPAIFLLALERAGLTASEAVHVGDQYKLDVLGARGVGITPILIDRSDNYPEINDCPRIQNLTEITDHI